MVLVLEAKPANIKEISGSLSALVRLAGENTNFKYAFCWLGQCNASTRKYDEALKYFRYAEERDRYSDTVALIRKQKVQAYFPIIWEL